MNIFSKLNKFLNKIGEKAAINELAIIENQVSKYISPDPVVNEVNKERVKRAKEGYIKYNSTLQDNIKNRDLLVDLMEELQDAVVYTKAEMMKRDIITKLLVEASDISKDDKVVELIEEAIDLLTSTHKK